MSLIEWGLSKLRTELALPALFRVAASLTGIATVSCLALQKAIQPYRSTPIGLFASAAEHIRMPSAERSLTNAEQWLAQPPQHQLIELLAIAAICSGFYFSARYRVSPIENLHVSGTWVGLATLRELGYAAWTLALISVVASIIVAMQHVIRFGAQYHGLRDRFGYIFIHLFGSLVDSAWLIGFLLIRGSMALGWQWVIINPRAEYWRLIDDGLGAWQPRGQIFVMFGSPRIADLVRDNPEMNRADLWRLLKRSGETEWGLESED
jgi:hypothetical protein